MFSCFGLSLPGPGRQLNEPFFGLSFFLESRLSSESLEPFIGFLVYLDAKLWLKNKKSVKLSTPTNADPGYVTHIWYMVITPQRIELESCSNPL